MKEIPR